MVDAGRRRRVAAEHLALDLFAVDAEAPQHRVVRVDDGVEQPVHDRFRAEAHSFLVGEQGAFATVGRRRALARDRGAVGAVDPKRWSWQSTATARPRTRMWNSENSTSSDSSM
ncbi:MAG: hypothetical protein R2692_07975 [Microbacterium sp.]